MRQGIWDVNKVVNFVSDARPADLCNLLSLSSERFWPLFDVVVVLVENLVRCCQKLREVKSGVDMNEVSRSRVFSGGPEQNVTCLAQ